MLNRFIYFLAILALTSNISCDKDGDLNVFSVNKDIELGMQVSRQIESDPENYPVLDESSYPEAYAYIQKITDAILNSGEVQYKDRFAWEVKIIDADVLNAFCAPGGYIYVYTGLIKYLDNENELAGVMGHEIAHADKRHSTDALTRELGLSTLLQIVSGGEPSQLAQIAAGLSTLKYGRNQEKEADEYSVIYLCPTEYKADGASGFFEKLVDSGAQSPPEFLSTHPDPENRVEDIKSNAEASNCGGTVTLGEYNDFKNSLP